MHHFGDCYSHKNCTSITDAPEIARSNANVNYNEGETAHLVCDVIANPEPTRLEWMDPSGHVIEETETVISSPPPFRKVIEFSAHVEVGQDTVFGNYSCFAANDYGNDSHVVLLSGQKFPGSPTHLKVVVISATSLKLSWAHGLEDKTSVTFNVKYCRNNSRSTCTVVDDLQSQTLLMPGLSIYTWYWVAVCAENAFGQSRKCGEIVTSTPRTLTSKSFGSGSKVSRIDKAAYNKKNRSR
ncbi:uncharacterized protein LOC100890743 [Strongylocentrotus purpuratus]|uniref:Uncharacterized protein n=1 Tax=Strongylocentrotus purpuratus TaxID=7668 RepID=A0A7M7PG06_STRPU|nr:uncharacterized protein LOC100890743 [Strongylocentrotus purpuratus]